MIIDDIALTLTPGLGPKGIVHLIEVFGSAERIFAASRGELVSRAQLREGVADAIVAKVGYSSAKREVAHCQRNSITAVAATDSSYPPLLREVADRPHVLYVMGRVEALHRRCVSVVGTRRVSSYGQLHCVEFVHNLSTLIEGITIVSGLAFGVDSEAHRASLQYGVPTVAVLANPLPQVNPGQHSALARDIIKRGGALVSEFHSQVKQRGNLYTARNRIIAALSSATLLVESPLSGGSMVTAHYAAGYERLVMAIPGRVNDQNSKGCNLLIANRTALLYYSAEQLARELMWDIDAPSDRAVVVADEPDLSVEQRGLMECFRSEEPLSISDLATLTSLDVATLSTMLLELELMGKLRVVSGNRYLPLQSATTR